MSHRFLIAAIDESAVDDVLSLGHRDGDFVVLSDKAYRDIVSRYSHQRQLQSEAVAAAQKKGRVFGPGTELSALLKRFGIEPTPKCACRAKAAEMDAWGPDECAKPHRIEEVLAVMRAEANARGLPFLDAAGRLLIRRAIANARRKEAARVATEAADRPPLRSQQ